MGRWEVGLGSWLGEGYGGEWEGCGEVVNEKYRNSHFMFLEDIGWFHWEDIDCDDDDPARKVLGDDVTYHDEERPKELHGVLQGPPGLAGAVRGPLVNCWGRPRMHAEMI